MTTNEIQKTNEENKILFIIMVFLHSKVLLTTIKEKNNLTNCFYI